MEIRKDVCAGRENCRFTLRAAALILKDDCLLTAKHDDYDCYYTIGGGVRMNESTVDAVRREILEETGFHAAIDRLAYVQERFYKADNKMHHELTFFYLVESANISVQNGSPTDHVKEHMYWLPIKQLSDYPLVPEFLRKELQNIPPSVRHIITNGTDEG